MKKIAIFGSTGSIGTQALNIIERHPDKFSVEVLSCRAQVETLSQQIEKFKPSAAVVSADEDAKYLAGKYPGTEILCGIDGLTEAAKGGSDMMLNGMMGISGLIPTYHAIKTGKDIALANKETLVAGGSLIMKEVKAQGVKMLPVDSEHSAIFQCLQGNDAKDVRRILLTASGGPFRGFTPEQLKKATLSQALKHPKWEMGSKITIDSATMMNKGLEVIEAKWLFDVSEEQIQIAVHPQSIVHSAVEYTDGSIISQMGQPDMRIPISYALGFPQRIENNLTSLDLFGEGATLTFEKPDTKTFKTITLAYEASRMGGSCPVVLNGANEVLVQLFLEKRIPFADIQNYLERVLDNHTPQYNLDLEGILEMDQEARTMVRKLLL